jgi:putative Mn2+ efflux pump MntP
VTEEIRVSLLSVLIIAVGLAMDAFAVSISSGITLKRMQAKHALVIASFFGTFQAIMPFIGWTVGQWAKAHVAAFDHWIAFALLVMVGVKMIHDSLKDEESRVVRDPLNIYILFVLAIATSIDALAVGVTLSFLDVAIVMPVILIGIVTFAMSFVGTYLGNLIGGVLGRRIETAAGLLLIGIGVKILIEHTLL